MINYAINKYKNLGLLARFVVNILFLFIIWFGFYTFFRYLPFVHQIYEYLTKNLTAFLLFAGQHLLSLFGYETEIEGKIIRIIGTGGVLLDRGCLARNLMGLFAGFILAFPSKIKHKLWAIPTGLIIINIFNIIRIAALAFVVLEYPDYVDINHHVIFKYTVYFFIFLMWFFWIKYFSFSAKKYEKNE